MTTERRNTITRSPFTAIAFLAVAGLGGLPARAAEPDTFRIGAILSMSGSAPHYGTVMSRGAQIAIDEINAKGGIDGKKLELVIEDHKSGNTQAAVAGMNRLITISGTPAVLSSFSGPTVAIAPISEEKQIFVHNGGGVSPRMIGVSKYMFHNRALAADLAAGIIRRAHERGLSKVAQVAINVRHENSRWGTFDVGDEVLPRIRLPWLGFFAQWHRITQISYSPDAGIATLKLSRRDAFSSR